jgi:hypothetical protein
MRGIKMNNLDSYLNEIYFTEEIQQVSEGFFDFLPNLNVKQLIRKVKDSVDETNPIETIKKISKIIPSGITEKKLKQAEETLTSKIDIYPKLKTTATNVIKNSLPNASNKVAELAGAYVAISSFISKKSEANITPEKNLRNNLKKFVYDVRKFTDDYSEEKTSSLKFKASDYTDMIIGFVIVSSFVMVVGSILTGSYIIINTIGKMIMFVAGLLPTAGIMLLMLIICFVVVYIITKARAGDI